MARPKKKIDYELVSKLASLHCTQEEIASVLDVDVRTLQRDKEFCRIYKKGLEDGRMSLRRIQWSLAANSVPMAIWLGKQILHQKENPEPDTDQTIIVKLEGFEDGDDY